MTNISKLDYLQRYMSQDDKKGKKGSKKKKKIKKSYGSSIKIIDNDISIADINKQVSGDEFDLEEEKPLIFAEDGMTLNKEYEEQQEKVNKWNPLNNKNNENIKTSTRGRHDSDSDSDLSVKRIKLSPKIKKKVSRRRHDSSGSDLSPERPGRTQESDSDLSPQRNHGNDSESDVSPPRKHTKSNTGKRKEHNPEVIKETKRSGLQSGSELKIENLARKEREKLMFDSLDKVVSGKDAQTVYRDRKSGKKIDVKFEELKKCKEEERKLADKEQFVKWGKGLAQEKSQQEKIDEHLHEIQKPLARYKDDKDLDHLLKEIDRDGDPMLAYLTKKKDKVSKVSKPRYKGPTPAPNRFNIWPGYRYDGVDRSNGFEKKRFLAITNVKSLKNDAYKWSTEDM